MPKRKKLYARRAAIEAKISAGERIAGLDKSSYKGFKGDKICVVLSIMTLNIRNLVLDVMEKPQQSKSKNAVIYQELLKEPSGGVGWRNAT